MSSITGNNFFTRLLKKLSLDLLILIIIFCACLFILFEVADMVFEDKNLSFDNHVFAVMDAHTNDRNTSIMEFFTFFGSQYFLLPANILLAGIFVFIRKKHIDAIKIISVSITSTAVMFLLKNFLQRQRPSAPLVARAHNYSFPSGHSFTSVVFFGMLIYIVYRSVKRPALKWLLIAILFLFPLFIGVSRVYLKLHFASDVIAGFCLGTIWLLLARWVLVKAEKAIDKTATHAPASQSPGNG